MFNWGGRCSERLEVMRPRVSCRWSCIVHNLLTRKRKNGSRLSTDARDPDRHRLRRQSLGLRDQVGWLPSGTEKHGNTVRLWSRNGIDAKIADRIVRSASVTQTVTALVPQLNFAAVPWPAYCRMPLTQKNRPGNSLAGRACFQKRVTRPERPPGSQPRVFW
jgi:hypothetical protein